MPPRWRGESRSSPLQCFVSRPADLPAMDSLRRRSYRRSRTVPPSRAITEVQNLRCGGANDQQARACARPVTPESAKQGETLSPTARNVSGPVRSKQRVEAEFSPDGLPDYNRAEHRQRNDRQAEIHPCPIRAGVLGQDEKVHDKPRTDAGTHQHADEIAWRLVDRRETLDLRACDPRGQYRQNDQK
jgi:hypothetical protein